MCSTAQHKPDLQEQARVGFHPNLRTYVKKNKEGRENKKRVFRVSLPLLVAESKEREQKTREKDEK